MSDDDIGYEILVQSLLQAKLGEDVKVFRNRRYRGKASGHEHQIDVSFEIDVADTNVLVLVECKRYSHPVGVDDVLEFASRLSDIGAHKGILISTAKFQPGAIKVASARGIALIVSDGLTYVSVNRQDVPSDALTSIVRENALASYFASVCGIPVDAALSVIDEERRLSSSPQSRFPYREYGGVFGDLAALFALCSFATVAEHTTYAVARGQPISTDLPFKYARLRRDEISCHVNQIFGPYVIIFAIYVLEGVAFSLCGGPDPVVVTPTGLVRAIALEYRIRHQLGELVSSVPSPPDVAVLSGRFERYANELGWNQSRAT